MIYKVHDKDDRVISYVVYYLLDKSGKFDPHGDYAYVEDIWVHKSMRFKHTMWKMLRTLIPRHSNKYIYWARGKYKDRIKIYEIVRGNRIKLIKKEI